MFEALLTFGLLAGLPFAYFRGKRIGFERHHCVRMAQFADRAPQTYVVVPCPACQTQIECALHVERSFSGGVPTISATVDATDLEHHTLTHVDEVHRPAA